MSDQVRRLRNDPQFEHEYDYWCYGIAINFDIVCDHLNEDPIDCIKLAAQATPDVTAKRFAEIYRQTGIALPTFENFARIITLTHAAMKNGQVDASLLSEVTQEAAENWEAAQFYYVPRIKIEGACSLPQPPLEQSVSAFKSAHELMVLLNEKIQPDGMMDLAPSLRRYLRTTVARYSPFYNNTKSLGLT